MNEPSRDSIAIAEAVASVPLPACAAARGGVKPGRVKPCCGHCDTLGDSFEYLKLDQGVRWELED